LNPIRPNSTKCTVAEVVLKKISKVYDGGVTAVKELSFEVKDKEFLVLVGPSGCGKSTLLRMIAGLEEISGGDLFIDGKRCNDVAPKDRDIAMVFQNYALYPHMTVEENLAFGLKLRKFPSADIKARVAEAAEMLGITPYLARKPKALSGGQSSANPRCSCSTNRSPTSTPRCACKCASKSRACRPSCRPP
jgi:multiple sugar transport system ATP-binding protein